MELTPKQQQFVIEYVKDFNGSQAVIRAGYAESGSRTQAARLLANDSIIEQIRSIQNRSATKAGVTREKVLAEYAKLAFFDARKLYDENDQLIKIRELDDDTAASITGVEVDEHFDLFGELNGKTKKIKLSDKRAALDSIARFEGYNMPDKTEQSGKIEYDVKIGRSKED